MKSIPLLTILASTIAGCSQAPETTYAPASKAPAASSPGAVNMPPGMSVGSGGQLTPTPQLDARISGLEKQHADKKKIAAAYVERGDERMFDAEAAPRVKYRLALADYRHALALDPANSKARINKDMIEGIYRKMGRPIPH